MLTAQHPASVFGHTGVVVAARELLDRGARHGLRLLAGPTEGRAVHEVGTVAALSDIERHRAGGLLLVLPSAISAAAAYELDIAVRLAIEHDQAALLFVGLRELPVTTRHLADHAGVAVLSTTACDDLAELVIWADRVVRGGAADILSRAEAALAALTGRVFAEESELLAAVGGALGTQVVLHPGDDSASGAAVVVQDRVLGRVAVTEQDRAAALVLPLVAVEVARLKQRRLERELAPARTRAELLGQLVVAEPGRLPMLADQARHLGFPLDRTHVAAWLDVWPLGHSDHDPETLTSRRRLATGVELAGLERFGHQQTWWHLSRLGGSLLLVCSDDLDGDRISARVRREVQGLIADETRDGDLVVYAGVGTYRYGLDGLRASAEEARAAADSAARHARAGELVPFDSTGVTRVLVELGSSPISRRVVADLLRPLDDLGPSRAAQAVETLAVYLDCRSSPRHSAERLHLHPNAVVYRIKRIVDRLGVDLTDPDVRFALHLACRLRQAQAG